MADIRRRRTQDREGLGVGYPVIVDVKRKGAESIHGSLDSDGVRGVGLLGGLPARFQCEGLRRSRTQAGQRQARTAESH